MTRIRTLVIATALAAGTATAAIGQASPAAALFQQGLLLERAEGKVGQAIVLYERVIAEYPKDSVVPQVLEHLAQTYERQNNPRSTRIWSRLATEYPSSTQAAEARSKLAATQASGPFRVKTLDPGISLLSGTTVSGDARTLAFVRETATGAELMVRDLDTARERRLLAAQGSTLLWPNWSPDSRKISVAIRPLDKSAASNSPHDEVRIVTVQTAQARTVASAANINPISGAWSPNSQWLVMSFAGEVRVVDAATGESKKLAVPSRAGGFAWSADSRQVVFHGQGYTFSVIEIETGQIRTMAMPLKAEDGPVNLAIGVTQRMTTDSRFLVRQISGGRGAGTSFYLISTDGKRVQKTCTTVGGFQCLQAMTPDGRFRVGTDSAAGRVMLVDATTGASKRVTSSFATESSPLLSPDGQLLAFASNHDGNWAVYVVPVDRTPVADPLRVTSLPMRGSVRTQAWGDDGRLVLSLSFEERDIFRISTYRNGRSAGALGRLTHDTRHNQWAAVSPSGQIAYTFENGIAVMTADGAGERPVSSVVPVGHLEWRSQDEILFRRPLAPGTTIANSPAVIASLNVKTGTLQSVTALPAIRGEWQFVPSRDEIVYVSAGQLRARSLADGADRTIAGVPDILGFQMIFRVSPDGREVAYGRWSGTGPGRRLELHVMTMDGKDDRIILTSTDPTGSWAPSGYPHAWSPDGRLLLYETHPGRLMVADVKSGESWPIEQAVDTDTSEFFAANWSPDGSFIVVTRSGYRYEWRQLDGVTYDNVIKAMAGRK